jgi:Ni,Fe-hydrogenase III component G
MEILSLEDRARETGERHPRFAGEIERAIPLAQAIEREVFDGLGFGPADLASHVAVPS